MQILGPINKGMVMTSSLNSLSYHCTNLIFWKGKGKEQIPCFVKPNHPSTEKKSFSGI